MRKSYLSKTEALILVISRKEKRRMYSGKIYMIEFDVPQGRGSGVENGTRFSVFGPYKITK